MISSGSDEDTAVAVARHKRMLDEWASKTSSEDQQYVGPPLHIPYQRPDLPKIEAGQGTTEIPKLPTTGMISMVISFTIGILFLLGALFT